VVQQHVTVQGGWRTSQPPENRVPHISILRCGQSRSDPLPPIFIADTKLLQRPKRARKLPHFSCWSQWNAATECNIRLPLAAFPMHYYPAARCNQSCHLIRSGLDYQIERSAAAWPLRSEQTGSKVRIAGNTPTSNACSPILHHLADTSTDAKSSPPWRWNLNLTMYIRILPCSCTCTCSYSCSICTPPLFPKG
jgi:hypothetical protein